MKKLTTLFTTLLITTISFSQNENCDDLIFKNGEEIYGLISEITTSEVKYKRCDNPEGPTFSLEKSKLLMIRYKNGTKDVFNSTELKSSSKKSSVSNETNKATFGFRLGLQNVGVGNSSTIVQRYYGSRAGLLLGFTTFIPIGKKIDLRTGLIYTSKGAEYPYLSPVTNNYEYLALNYLEVPIDFAFKIGNGGFALNIGPYLAFLMKAKDYDLDGSEIDLNSASPEWYRGFDFGLNLGPSWLIAGKFNLDLRYGMGLIDITTYDYDGSNTQVNAALQFSFGMQF